MCFFTVMAWVWYFRVNGLGLGFLFVVPDLYPDIATQTHIALTSIFYLSLLQIDMLYTMTARILFYEILITLST